MIPKIMVNQPRFGAIYILNAESSVKLNQWAGDEVNRHFTTPAFQPKVDTDIKKQAQIIAHAHRIKVFHLLINDPYLSLGAKFQSRYDVLFPRLQSFITRVFSVTQSKIERSDFSKAIILYLKDSRMVLLTGIDVARMKHNQQFKKLLKQPMVSVPDFEALLAWRRADTNYPCTIKYFDTLEKQPDTMVPHSRNHVASNIPSKATS